MLGLLTDRPCSVQVAKALLDTAAKQPPRPQAPSLQGASFADLSIIASLLRFQEVSSCPLYHPQQPTYLSKALALYRQLIDMRLSLVPMQDALTAQIGGAMAQAAKGAASQGKKAAAAAATDAYEDNLDLAVALGWAFVDRVSFEVLTLTHIPIPVHILWDVSG